MNHLQSIKTFISVACYTNQLASTQIDDLFAVSVSASIIIGGQKFGGFFLVEHFKGRA